MITDNASERVDLIVKKHKINEIFDPIFVSEDVGLMKNTPEVFEKILHSVGSAVFIDNKQKNCDNATKAGIKGIYFDDKERDYEKLLKDLENLGVKI